MGGSRGGVGAARGALGIVFSGRSLVTCRAERRQNAVAVAFERRGWNAHCEGKKEKRKPSNAFVVGRNIYAHRVAFVVVDTSWESFDFSLN